MLEIGRQHFSPCYLKQGMILYGPDLMGVIVSTGVACDSKETKASHEKEDFLALPVCLAIVS